MGRSLEKQSALTADVPQMKKDPRITRSLSWSELEGCLQVQWRFCMEGQELPGSCLCSELGCHMSIKPLFGGKHWKNCFLLVLRPQLPPCNSKFYLSPQLHSAYKGWLSALLVTLPTNQGKHLLKKVETLLEVGARDLLVKEVSCSVCLNGHLLVSNQVLFESPSLTSVHWTLRAPLQIRT